jgi:DNA-binding XRE family transcriptional regulator
LSSTQRTAKFLAAKLESRRERGFQLRGLYRELGHDRASIGKFLHVTPRTLRNWETGRVAIPVATLKLLRLLRRSELPGKDWAGWSFNRGTLWSPEGHGFKGSDMAWLSRTVRQAQLFSVLYRERGQLRRELLLAHQQTAEAQAAAVSAEGRAAMVDLAIWGALPAVEASNELVQPNDRPARPSRSGAATGRAGRRLLVTPSGSLTGETAPTVGGAA